MIVQLVGGIFFYLKNTSVPRLVLGKIVCDLYRIVSSIGCQVNIVHSQVIELYLFRRLRFRLNRFRAYCPEPNSQSDSVRTFPPEWNADYHLIISHTLRPLYPVRERVQRRYEYSHRALFFFQSNPSETWADLVSIYSIYGRIQNNWIFLKRDC